MKIDFNIECLFVLTILGTIGSHHLCHCSDGNFTNSISTNAMVTVSSIAVLNTTTVGYESNNYTWTTSTPSLTSFSILSTMQISTTTKSVDKTEQTEQFEKKIIQNKKKWSINNEGNQSQLPYTLNCSIDSMAIQVNLSAFGPDDEPYIYLEKLRSFSICRPKIVKSIATFHLSLDDNFYRCGTTKVHDQITGTRIYYNRVIVETKRTNRQRSIYFKCSQPSLDRLLAFRVSKENPIRNKRESWIQDSTGSLVNFTEIDLPENFMEAEILDFTDNITARAPYPHLNLKVKQNGQFVNTSLNVAPGTPLEMIIYLDDQSKHVYGLLASFMKVTDNSNKQQEVIVLNGCSIDPYIFGNFETEDNGDSIAAKFRAFKFPESNYVMFVGTVNVCLDQCKKVPCGNGIYGLGKRRRRRSLSEDLLEDPNKVFEVEMMAYLRIGYSPEELTRRHSALQATYAKTNGQIEAFQEVHSTEIAKLIDNSISTVMGQYESLTSSSIMFNVHFLSIFFSVLWLII